MKKYTNKSSAEVIDLLHSGGIGIMLTDTLYGLLANANNQHAVERVYQVKGRDVSKPCIVLIDNVTQIWDFSLSAVNQSVLKHYWPGRVSIVLPAGEGTPDFIRRGGDSVAFRMPNDPELRKLLCATGPLIAPSANPEGAPPAMDIAEAVRYFGDTVDFYVDSGTCRSSQPSRLIELTRNNEVKVLR